MKLERITDKKFRIIVYIDELKEKNIDLPIFLNDKNLSSNFISSILKDAGKKFGFNFDNSKLLVEAFTSENDFLILICSIINEKKSSKLINNMSKNKILLYKFNSFEDFCEFSTYINSLCNLNSLPKNIALYEYNSNYYLYIPINYYNNTHILFTSILEFAQLISSKNVINYKIFEYGNIIFKNDAFGNCIRFFTNT